jgi:membrane-bound ClpP family serine protease
MELLVGIVLIAAGAGLLVAEAHLPTAGILGALGVASLGAGTVLAIAGEGGSVVLAVSLALVVCLVSGTGLVYATREALRAQRRRARGGAEGLIGHVGVVRSPPEPLGQVFVDGALWRARPVLLDDPDEEPLRPGDPVVVERVAGLTLCVRRADPLELPS